MVDYQKAYVRSQPLGELWPDRRRGSGQGRKRKPRAPTAASSLSAEAPRVASKAKFRCVEIDSELQDASELVVVDDREEVDIDGATYELLNFNEDEDPWGEQEERWQEF